MELQLQRLNARLGWLIFAIWVLIATLVVGQVRAAEIVAIPTPADAATLAQTDNASLPAQDAPFQFYVWIEPWETQYGYAVAAQWANEVLSRSSVLFAPARIVAGDIELARIDLRVAAPNKRDLQDLFDNLNRLQSIYFSYEKVFPVGDRQFKKQVQVLEAAFRGIGDQPVWKEVEYAGDEDETRALIWWRGHKTWHPKKFLRHTVKFQTVAEQAVEDREESRALGDTAQLLPQFTQQNVPIIRLDELIGQTYHSDPERQGLYYQFVGLIKGGKRITFDELKAEFGVGGAEVKLPLLCSQVTGKPRIVEIATGNQVRRSLGTGLFTYTLDPTDAQAEAGVDWLIDLDEFERKSIAHELIAERRNGTNLYGIFADQLLLDTVPDNVAPNHEVAKPYTSRLAAGIGCIMCHSVEDKTEGYRTAQNDFLAFAARSPRFRAFFQQDQVLKAERIDFKQAFANNGRGGPDVRVLQQDEYRVKQFQDFELFEELAGTYFASGERAIHRGRQDRSTAIARVAGIKEIQATSSAATLVGLATVKVFNTYHHSQVSPRMALRDVGFEAPDDATAAAAFARALGTPLGFDDPLVDALANGLAVNPGSYRRVYPKIIANRAANVRLLHRK